MKRFFMVIIIPLGILMAAGCVYAVRYDGEYAGRVVDADTGQPIEGVVVLGEWSKEYWGAGGAAHRFYDAKETVTDKNGDFALSGQGIEIMSNVTSMDVLIFKAGYEYVGLGPWESFKEDEILKAKIGWEGNRAIIPLKKLSMEERKKQGSPDLTYAREIIERNLKLMLEEINKDRIDRDLRPIELRK